MTGWPIVTLAEVSAKPQYGAIAKGSNKPVGPPFVRQTDIASGRIDWSTVPFCDLSPREFTKYAIHPGDLLISRLGNGVGNAATVSEPRGAVFAGYLVRFKPDPDLAVSEFVGYQLQSDAWRQHVSGFRSGAAQPTLNAQQMGAFSFLLPPVGVQREIVATLGALDEKMESNRYVTDLVQKLSQAVYKSWKVRHPLRRRTSFGSFAQVFGGATPRTTVPEFWNGEVNWATPTDITALKAPYLFRTARTVSEAGLASTSATLHPPGTILMTSRATIGAFAINQVPTATNQGFIAVRPDNPEHRWFLFEEMRSRVPDMLDRANGSTFMELSRGNFKLMELDVPEDEALCDLDAELAPLHAKAAQLTAESERLAAFRDVLLPELLAGRVSARGGRGAVEVTT